MRRALFIFVFLFVCFSLFSQATYWEETFSPAPAEWTLASNWSFLDGALQFSWTPVIPNYDLSAVSPVISLPQNVGDMILTQYIDNFSAVDEIMEIGVIVEGVQTALWQYELINGNWGTFGTGDELVLPLTDFAGQDVQLEFRSYGSDTWNLNYWYIYDVMITVLCDNDLSAYEVYGPPNAELNQPDLWKVIVKNCGLLPQTNYTVKIFKEGGTELGNLDIYETIEPLGFAEHNFFWTPVDLEDTHLYGEVILPGDEFNGNDQSAIHYLTIYPEGERQYLVWDNDNDSYYIDPNTGAIRDSEDGVEEALAANGINYDFVNELPKVLRNYNAVFVCLGLYCVG